jgi:hypothetical protein
MPLRIGKASKFSLVTHHAPRRIQLVVISARGRDSEFGHSVRTGAVRSPRTQTYHRDLKLSTELLIALGPATAILSAHHER